MTEKRLEAAEFYANDVRAAVATLNEKLLLAHRRGVWVDLDVGTLDEEGGDGAPTVIFNEALLRLKAAG